MAEPGEDAARAAHTPAGEPHDPAAPRAPTSTPPDAAAPKPVTDPVVDRAPQRAVLDAAHVGDIRGAFGTIRQHDTGARRSNRARLRTLLAVMGPGMIVMVGDNDAGGVSTYSQAGQNYGTSLLWVLLLLVPVVIVNQEMVVRLGAVTGVGHARLIFERFGRFWGAFAVIDLFILNFLTIVTEFIGVDLALGYFGVPPVVSVLAAAALLVGMTVTGSFRRWEQVMYVFVISNLLVIPLVLLSGPHIPTVVHDSFVPSVYGGINSTSVLLIIAIVGTTVAPWQLFFQQSNVIDKRITPRWINYERADTVIGALIVVIGAGCLIVTSAYAFGSTPLFGHFTDAGGRADGIRQAMGPAAGAIYAIVLLNASLIGAGAVTLSTSYAFGDAFGVRHSLHRPFREARGFYGSYAAIVLAAGAIVLIPNAPLGLITTAVQALAGVLLPSATVFLVLLCNDTDVLGPWVNPTWLNAIATVIVGVLLMLSGILTATTVFPSVNVATLALVLAAVLVIGAAALGAASFAGRGAAPARTYDTPRELWTMPPRALLNKPVWSTSRKMVMGVMWVYLVVAVALLVVKAVQLGSG
jgi:Mn2+/Fe2+ NRAMP family transporter